MTNQERIIAHNSMIDEAIAKANSLPDAGSGSSEAVINSLTITENGTYNAPSGVDGYNPIMVNVPIPSGYIKPSGTKSVTSNGTHDVNQYASVSVNVPIPSGYIKPSGTKSITTNGAHDVASYETVNVNVPPESGGGLPSGVAALASGTFTPTSNAAAYYEVTHNLGVVPNFIIWQNTTDFSENVEASVAISGAMFHRKIRYSTSNTTTRDIVYYVTGYNANSLMANTTQSASFDDEMTSTTALVRTTSSYPLKAGHTYRWVCGVMG